MTFDLSSCYFKVTIRKTYYLLHITFLKPKTYYLKLTPSASSSQPKNPGPSEGNLTIPFCPLICDGPL